MKFHTYLIAWDDVHFNAIEIEKEVVSFGSPITVVNSGNMKRDHWHNIGDIRYYRQLRYSIKNFLDSNQEYLLFLAADLQSNNWKDILNRANSILEQYPSIGLYAPHLTSEYWNEERSKVKDFEYDNNLTFSCQTDGIMVFINKKIAKILNNFFDFFYNSHDESKYTSGWGMDMIWCSLADYYGLFIIRDKAYIPVHPEGSSYDHSKAFKEYDEIISSFYDFCDIEKINKEEIKRIIGQIDQRRK